MRILRGAGKKGAGVTAVRCLSDLNQRVQVLLI